LLQKVHNQIKMASLRTFSIVCTYIVTNNYMHEDKEVTFKQPIVDT